MNMECKNPLVYDELNKLIFEFMEINGMSKTLETFAQECESKGLPCPKLNEDPDTKVAFSQDEGAKLLKAFDDGDLLEFFKYWDYFQSHIQVTSDDMTKLEVYIRVHFALWPRAHNQSESVQVSAMDELKMFFEQQKACLGKDSAILPLYALPFVEDPFTHPIFKELFKDAWISKLRSQLESTLQKYFELLQENICQHSRLAELIVKGERFEECNFAERKDNSSGQYQDRFFQLLSNHRKIRKLLQGTRESYAKLLLVTNELVQGFEQSVKGKDVQLESVLVDKCYTIFPEIFTPKDSLEDGKPDIEYFKQISATANFDPTQDSEVSLFFLGIVNVSPEFLDYEKIKATLVLDTTASVSDKLCLLQAIRWLITKTTESCRQSAIAEFVQHDIFGLSRSHSEYRQKLFHCMCFPTPTYMKECLARLVNALSSTRTGRNYLSSSNFIAESLTKSLQTFTGPTESYICQMVVATLQKLSLKKSMRLFMIDHKVIPWLVAFINKELFEQSASSCESTSGGKGDQGSFNPYMMEYAWALLMNLCLHEEAWTSCLECGNDMIQNAANMLLSSPRRDLAPYVVSTLYSLLRCPDMYSLAREMRVETLIDPILKENTELSEHLNNLISLLYSPGCDRITSSRETNYDDEDSPDPDVFEPEIELTESWTTALEDCDLTGDDLLLRKYLADKVKPVVPKKSTNKGLKKSEDSIKGEIVRPITPSNKTTKGPATTATPGKSTNIPKRKLNPEPRASGSNEPKGSSRMRPGTQPQNTQHPSPIKPSKSRSVLAQDEQASTSSPNNNEPKAKKLPGQVKKIKKTTKVKEPDEDSPYLKPQNLGKKTVLFGGGGGEARVQPHSEGNDQ